jgi:intein-encoded DNA endonuclease-like protein
MRDIRDKINAEIVNMSPEQIIEYIRKGSLDFKKIMDSHPRII